MSGLQSLYNLLHKRLDLPCSVAAQEFLSSVKSENDRLSLATNGLVPLLENGKIEDSLRILAAYLLHAIYDFSGTPNPFYSRIAEFHALQQKQSILISPNEESSFYAPPTSQQQMTHLDRGLDGFKYLDIRGKDNSHISSADGLYSRYSGVPETHQEGSRSPFACVLWKILKGEAHEPLPSQLGTFSPTILADIRLWEPEEYQRRADLNLPLDTVSSPQPPQPHNVQVINDSRHIPMHATPSSSPLSSRLPFISPNYPAPLDGRRAVTPSDRYYPVQGYGLSTFVGDATVRPTAQRTNFLLAPGSSRPSSVAYPSHPSLSSASSTLDSSSINTPNSVVDTSTFALPRTDSTRVVDASAFYIPQVNRWSTRSEAEVALGSKDSADFKSSSLPHHVGRRFSPTITSKSSLQSSRNPGVIGSGRPSSRGPSEPSSESRASYIGISGDNGTGRYSPALEGLDIQALTLKQQIPRPIPPEHLDTPGTGGTLLYKTGGGAIEPPSNNHDSASHSQEKRDHLDLTSASPAIPQVKIESRPQLYSTFQDGVVDYSTRGPNSQASQSMKGGYSGDMDNKSTLTGEAVSAIRRSGALENMPEGRGTNTQKELGQISHLNSSPISPDTDVELSASQRRRNGGAEPDPVAIRERDELAEAIVLYLMARERVLTLQEQRKLQPHLSMLTRPICVLRPEDIPSLVANNQDIAVKLLLSLLSQDEKETQQIEELLKKIDLKNGRDGNGADSMNSLTLVSEMVKLVTSYGSVPPPSMNDLSSPIRGAVGIRRYLIALTELPPTIQSFNVIGKLLSPSQSGQPISEELRRIATLIRTEVLGGFISGCIRWIEKADRDEKEGSVHDDRVATATRNLCRFYTALIKYGMIAADSEEDTTEIMSFALQFSRFESAQKARRNVQDQAVRYEEMNGKIIKKNLQAKEAKKKE
ncbi:hypothetical protein Clacol_003507 [Clathrus columnatus]|uniref:CCR4-NOT transcription complex subunit 11 n=1 Tax=Clathrus columnatus TaxID=1419009 RepID=A0AAV5A4S3_9AGAM|nr:hypothetical protein Clacol_003507 [Clathrus columnatus]